MLRCSIRKQLLRGKVGGDAIPLAFIAPDIEKFRHSFQIKLPRCGVVMPVKGVHDQSYANWRAQKKNCVLSTPLITPPVQTWSS